MTQIYMSKSYLVCFVGSDVSLWCSCSRRCLENSRSRCYGGNMGRGQKNCFEVRPHFAVELHIADLLSITLILCLPDNFAYFLSSADFFRNQLFRKKIQEYHQNIKQFGFRSGLTFCGALSESKLFAKVISRWH